MFSNLPTVSTVEPFDNDTTCGIVVSFAEKDFGFGQITFALVKATGEAHIDTECMSPEQVGKILMRIPTTKE